MTSSAFFHTLRRASFSTLFVIAIASSSSAQERSSPAAEFAAGSLLFPDDGIVTEGFVGGTTRFYLNSRLSVGPEIAFIAGNNHSHLMLTGNLTIDLLDTNNRRGIVPFVVVGAGLFRTSEQFPSGQRFASSEGAFTAGGGVRAAVGSRLLVGGEARIGWEAHLRVNGFVGVRF